MALIRIADLASAAKARGFKVMHYTHSVEIWSPKHEGETAVWYAGSIYSTAEFNISDRPSIGYGYNPWFHGPFHDGYCQSDAFGVQKLLAHPAMQSNANG